MTVVPPSQRDPELTTWTWEETSSILFFFRKTMKKTMKSS